MRSTNKTAVIALALLACSSIPALQSDIVPPLAEIEHQPLIVHPLPNINDCPSDMVRIRLGKSRETSLQSFCIDRYEYPNIKGAYPDFAMSAYDAEQVCSDINKRLCSYKEWHRACVGSHDYYYSYGPTFKSGTCNDNKVYGAAPNWMLMWDRIAWKAYARTLYKGEPSGSRPNCVTDEGVYDLPANVREWVKDGDQYVVPSGYWYGTMEGPPTCSYVIRNHAKGFASYEFGTRCCKSITDDTIQNTSAN
jgi:formylglycine-generating enzyme required for sulfatase activity